MSFAPPFSLASIICWHSASVGAIGFSHNTWMPASSALTTKGVWSEFGVAR